MSEVVGYKSFAVTFKKYSNNTTTDRGVQVAQRILKRGYYIPGENDFLEGELNI